MACLRDTFEKTAAWLGDEAFDVAAIEHIAGNPPRSWTLSDYGDGFDVTLDGLYPADPEVPELAWLDWSLRRAFDGPDSTLQDPAAFADIDWDRAVFVLAPTLTTRHVTTNVAALWSAMGDAQTPPPVALLDAPLALAVWRRELSPRFRSLADAEFAALERARQGATFGEICAGLAEDHQDTDEAAAVAGGLLAQWLEDRIVVEIVPGAQG